MFIWLRPHPSGVNEWLPGFEGFGLEGEEGEEGVLIWLRPHPSGVNEWLPGFEGFGLEGEDLTPILAAAVQLPSAMTPHSPLSQPQLHTPHLPHLYISLLPHTSLLPFFPPRKQRQPFPPSHVIICFFFRQARDVQDPILAAAVQLPSGRSVVHRAAGGAGGLLCGEKEGRIGGRRGGCLLYPGVTTCTHILSLPPFLTHTHTLSHTSTHFPWISLEASCVMRGEGEG